VCQLLLLLLQLGEHVELVAQVRGGSHQALHLARLAVHLLGRGVPQPVRVAAYTGAALDERSKEGVEAAEQRVGAARGEAGHGAGEVAAGRCHLGERERQERGVVVGHEPPHALEADAFPVEPREVVGVQRAPQARGARHERRHLEG
jgi:hypothetical protein